MSDLLFSEDHEWVRVEGDVATIGISNFAQEQLGDVVFVELPAIGNVVVKGDEVAVVESVKAASEVYTPVSGDVVESNDGLSEEPGLINKSAEADGWFFKIKLADTGELGDLMDAEAYAAFAEEQG
jgi:glycine cleavage system H protein